MPHSPTSFRIGTRGSPLALAQANMVAAELARALRSKPSDFPLQIIRTSGDMTQDRALSEIGGKGLFTKEIDLAQLKGKIDLAVHSAKDLPTTLPEGLIIAGFLPREDVRDALIAPRYKSLSSLPIGAKIGTVSLRRQALLRKIRPDLNIVIMRGNVGTRIEKAHSGIVDGIILATAGLNRLNLSHEITELLSLESFPPAVGQGAIAIVTRENDRAAINAVANITDASLMHTLGAERAFLKALDGSCRTPIAGHAIIREGLLHFRGAVYSLDGQTSYNEASTCAPMEAEVLGRSLGEAIKARLPDAFFTALKGA